MSLRVALTLGVCVLATSASAQVGSVLRRQPIGPGLGGFTGTLGDDSFGESVAALGDLDGNGVADLAVGAPGSDDGGPNRGSIWILFLNPDGTVQAQTKISQTQGGFTGVLKDGGIFGARLDNVGDLDGDGVPELAVFSGKPSRIWILFLEPSGRVRSQTEDLFSDPVFVPRALPATFNGELGVGGMEALGDLDGDGLGDLAVGAPYDSDGNAWAGAIWILRFDTDGTVKGAHKISEIHGGFTGDLLSSELFGYSITQLGDMDGDGNRDLFVWARITGNAWLLYLDANERVSHQQVIANPGLGPNLAWLGDLNGDGNGEVIMSGGTVAFLRPDESVGKTLFNPPFVGSSFDVLGDLDGDRNPEVAAGIGHGTNGVVILSLDPSALRNGAGVNPLTLSQAAEPVIGSSWSVTLDCSGHASGLAALLGYSAPTLGSFAPYGEVLVTGTRYFHLKRAHTGGPTFFQLSVPARVELIGVPMFVQGACASASGAQLSNALDVLIGR